MNRSEQFSDAGALQIRIGIAGSLPRLRVLRRRRKVPCDSGPGITQGAVPCT